MLRDLEIHGRELLAVQVLGEVPEELRLTPERDARLLSQAEALARTDAVRLLDLVSAALEATANGGSARIQLELVLVKAAAPEVDPSTAALLAGSSGSSRRWLAAAARRRAAGGHRPRAPAPRPPSAGPPGPRVRAEPAAGAARRRAPRRLARARRSAPEARAPTPTRARADPETAPDPPAAAFAGEPELETVAACWPAVIDIVRKDNEMLAALLADARPVSLEGHDVTIAFPSDMAFLKQEGRAG